MKLAPLSQVKSSLQEFYKCQVQPEEQAIVHPHPWPLWPPGRGKGDADADGAFIATGFYSIFLFLYKKKSLKS